MKHPVTGYTALLLHAHLPYVRLEQEQITLEERWFYEAMVDTYLPLIELLERLFDEGVRFGLTLSLSPTLLAMIADPLMQQRTRAHLAALSELARQEVQRLHNDAAFAGTARMYASRYERLQDLYDRLDGDLIAKLRSLAASGCVELITCAATHAFLPLVKNDAALRAQLEAAVTEFRRHFGAAPAGIWLPECGYTPALEPHLQALGLRYFVVDAHTVGASATKPQAAAPRLTPSGACAFARDPETSTQVWSALAGYPGDPDYREYYRDIGFDLGQDGGAEWTYIKPYMLPDGVRIHTGLKYWRITDRDADVKEPYQPADAARKAQQHAEHFLAARRQQLRLQVEAASEADDASSSIAINPPIIVCPYDAELFGHWWFEGTQWLETVLRGFDKRRADVQSITLSDYLDRYPPAGESVQLPYSSWGRGGFAEVWLQPGNDWVYPLLHAAEDRMIHTARAHPRPGQLSDLQRRLLDQAAKQLMLAQSSDWTFIIDAGTVTEYAVNRIHTHLRQFHELLDLVDQSSSVDSIALSLVEPIENSTKHLLPLLTYTQYLPKLVPDLIQDLVQEHHLIPDRAQDDASVLRPGLAALSQLHVTPISSEPEQPIPKLRILMLAWEYPPHIIGGLARAVCGLSRQLTAMGHSVHVVTCQSPEVPLPMHEFHQGVHIHRARALQSLDPVNFIDWVFQMNLAFVDTMQALTEQGLKFDLIHAHDWLVYYAAKACKQQSKLPLIATIHATEYGRNQGNLEAELQKRIHSLECRLALEADRVIVCSHAMMKEVSQLFALPDDTIVRIPNGIVPYHKLGPASPEVSVRLIETFRELKQDRILCFLGRLVYEKGVHILIDAMHLVTSQLPNVKILIAGTGPAQEWLQNLALPLGDRVQFLGFLEEADKHFFLQHAELCLIPSLYEPFGIALLEAMANGTPVIVSDVGGLAEIITHGVNGCVVPPDNAPAWASQIIELLQNPVYGFQLANAAESLVHTDFTWTEIAASTVDVYTKMYGNIILPNNHL
jgi:1,4-alpha-glucan branching enzyme